MKNVKYILIILFVLIATAFASWYFFLRADRSTVVIKQPDTSTDSYLIVAFGDSLTAGYGLPLYESYPYQLEEILKSKGLNVKVINAGVSGETSKGNNERASFIRDTKPDMVIWGIGGNDALRGLSISEMKNNMESTISILKNTDKTPKILMLKMQSPLNAGPDYKKEFDKVYEELSTKHNLALVPFLVSDVFLNPTLMLQDRIHPNREGYAKLITDNLLGPVLSEVE